MAVGGDVSQTTWDGSALTVAFSGHPGVPPTHDIYWNNGTPTATCDGTTLSGLTVDPKRLVYSVTCGGPGPHTLIFAGEP
jgi:hypothetical protein